MFELPDGFSWDDIPEPDNWGTSPWLDAIALIRASNNHDGDAITVILNQELRRVGSIAQVLAQMCQTAVRSGRMTIEEFLEIQTDKTVEAMEENRLYGDGRPDGVEW